MLPYIARRTLAGVLVAMAASFVTFEIFFIAPELTHVDPALYFVGKIPPSPAGLRLVDEKFGFNLPWYEQYVDWLRGIVTGRELNNGSGVGVHCAAPCLGYSFRLSLPVTHIVAQALPIEISVVVGAAVLWLAGGVAIGVISALYPNTWWDRAGMTIALVGIAMPDFFLGPVLQLVFVYDLRWVPDQAYAPVLSDPARWFDSVVLAWVTEAFIFAALYARLMRASMLEALSGDVVRTARAKGLSRVGVARHGIRAAITPIVTLFGLDLGQLFAGTAIVETVFNLHGLGLISLEAVNDLDLPVILGVTVLATLVVVGLNIVVDVAYAFIDPRVSYA